MPAQCTVSRTYLGQALRRGLHSSKSYSAPRRSALSPFYRTKGAFFNILASRRVGVLVQYTILTAWCLGLLCSWTNLLLIRPPCRSAALTREERRMAAPSIEIFQFQLSDAKLERLGLDRRSERWPPHGKATYAGQDRRVVDMVFNGAILQTGQNLVFTSSY
ncbi:hypothetical protein F5Y04DRAFT_59998 [Hypomontagnella monticulosa]|nr:hypothetical protein F5Y04DRAFT_59998 [Hypomontagnella monticulosa]